jgi:hypothetical protein
MCLAPVVETYPAKLPDVLRLRIQTEAVDEPVAVLKMVTEGFDLISTGKEIGDMGK